MNNVTALLHAARDAEQFAKSYFSYVATLLNQLDTTAVASFIRELEAARAAQRTIFITGNGGSASTASHMATDFGFVTRAATQVPPVRVCALTDNTALLTAVANDTAYAEVFVAQLRIHYHPGDLLIVVSASGNSPNVVAAAKWVKERVGKVLGLIGFDGGALKALCDVSLHVKTPVGEYGPVEDIHLMLNHLIAAWLRSRIPAESQLCKPTVA